MASYLDLEAFKISIVQLTSGGAGRGALSDRPSMALNRDTLSVFDMGSITPV